MICDVFFATNEHRCFTNKKHEFVKKNNDACTTFFYRKGHKDHKEGTKNKKTFVKPLCPLRPLW
ncbi:MAG: hypothetical protein BWK80_03035 [Desulfobacteraceae bacterium IS3]|nr:MAG: hypothetical protein BWK80_03035 [Desulfobacteraceae bacterium IS3]